MDISSPALNSEIAIRLATPRDAAKVRDLRMEALTLHPESFAADFAMVAAEEAEKWSERIAEYERDLTSAISVAETHDSLVGMAGIGRGHWPKTWHSAILWGVFVQPGWRGQHVGERLVSGSVDWAANHGITIVKLGVNISNTAAIQCYARCGFTVYGIEPKALYHDGLYCDELLMARRIG